MRILNVVSVHEVATLREQLGGNAKCFRRTPKVGHAKCMALSMWNLSIMASEFCERACAPLVPCEVVRVAP